MIRMLLLPLLAATASLPPTPTPVEEPLLPVKQLRNLGRLTEDLAEFGRSEWVEHYESILEALGEEPDVRSERSSDVAEALSEAKGDRRDRERLSKRLAQVVETAAQSLTKPSEEATVERQRALAAQLIRLDENLAVAREALGHTRTEFGWASEQELQLTRGANALEQHIAAARRLEVPVTVEPSENPVACAILGEGALCARGAGLELHGTGLPEVLERRVANVARLIALGQFLLSTEEEKELRVPELLQARPAISVDSVLQFEAALISGHEQGHVTQDQLVVHRSTKLDGFHDDRGWSVLTWRPEADLMAALAFLAKWDLFDLTTQPGIQDAFLNWLCLRFLGTRKTLQYWRETTVSDAGTTAGGSTEVDVLWQAASSSFQGCREWVRARLEQGDRFHFGQTLRDQAGQLEGENLLVGTLVTEYLLMQDRMGGIYTSTLDRTDRVEAMEAALGCSLRDFDAEWTGWVRSSGASRGLIQQLASDAGVSADPIAAVAIEHLEDYRRRAAHGLRAFRPLQAFPSLSRGSQAHARYLTLHPKQQTAWPDAHEEYLDVEGFSAEGARAGLASVINFTGDVRTSIDSWMATFYHRLPLLERHLLGIGVGVEGEVVVLDATSLVARNWFDEWIVWPPRDGKNIPCRFAPELPNPVPGEDQSNWGYPITVQMSRNKAEGRTTLELSLHVGRGVDNPEIDCWTISPNAPHYPELAPADAWCLIPKAPLEPQTLYTIRGFCPETEIEEVWTFETQR